MTIQPPCPSFITCFHFCYNPFEDDSLYAFSLLFPYLRVATYVCFVRYARMFQSLYTYELFVIHVWVIRYTRVIHSLYAYVSSLIYVCFIRLIMKRHKFHREETQVSSWWDTDFTMVKITKHTWEKDAKHRRKQSMAGEKRKGIVWCKTGIRGRKNNEKGQWAGGSGAVAGNETARYQRVTGCLYI